MEKVQKSSINAKSTDKKGSNSKMIKREEMKDSPFTIVTVDKRSFGVMGQYRITEEYATKSAVRTELEKVTWNRIIQVIMLLNKKLEE